MSVADDVRLIRNTIAVDINRDTTIIRVEGEGAWDTLYRILPCDMFLSDSQIRHTVFLSAQGTILADVYVFDDNDEFLLLIDGLSPEESLTHIGISEDTILKDQSSQYTIVSINGPFSWELLGKIDSLGAIGLPYLSFYPFSDDIICYRAGVTGEYSYSFIVPHKKESKFIENMMEKGLEYGTRIVSPKAIEYCRLENWFFNPHQEGKHIKNPFELQLSWRIRTQYDFHGAESLQNGCSQRITGFRSIEAVQGDVFLQEQLIGRIIHCEKDLFADGFFGIAILKNEYAHSGVHSYRAGSIQIQTLSPPFVINRSLFVKPQKHSFQERKNIDIVPSLEWEL